MLLSGRGGQFPLTVDPKGHSVQGAFSPATSFVQRWTLLQRTLVLEVGFRKSVKERSALCMGTRAHDRAFLKPVFFRKQTFFQNPAPVGSQHLFRLPPQCLIFRWRVGAVHCSMSATPPVPQHFTCVSSNGSRVACWSSMHSKKT